MKTIIGAFALILAAPVAAQTAPAGDPQAGHAQHQQGAPAKHKMDCTCCDEAKDIAQTKDCRAEHAKHSAEHASHSNQ